MKVQLLNQHYDPHKKYYDSNKTIKYKAVTFGAKRGSDLLNNEKTDIFSIQGVDPVMKIKDKGITNMEDMINSELKNINLSKRVIIGKKKINLGDLREIFKEMINKGLSQRKMAEELNSNEPRVNYFLNMLGLKTRKYTKNHSTLIRGAKTFTISEYEKELYKLIEKGLTQAEIAKELNVDASQIRLDLTRFNMETKSQILRKKQIIRGYKTWNYKEYVTKLTELADKGLTRKEIAKELKISMSQIHQDLKKIDIKTIDCNGKKRWNQTEYFTKLQELAENGYSQRKISDILGVSLVTINKDLKKLCIKTKRMAKRTLK